MFFAQTQSHRPKKYTAKEFPLVPALSNDIHDSCSSSLNVFITLECKLKRTNADWKRHIALPSNAVHFNDKATETNADFICYGEIVEIQ